MYVTKNVFTVGKKIRIHNFRHFMHLITINEAPKTIKLLDINMTLNFKCFIRFNKYQSIIKALQYKAL